MSTRKVVLTEHQHELIDRLVKSGRYQDASEVLHEGLQLIEQRDKIEAAKIETLQTAARLGFADLEQGRFTDVRIDSLADYVAGLGKSAVAHIERERSKDDG